MQLRRWKEVTAERILAFFAVSKGRSDCGGGLIPAVSKAPAQSLTHSLQWDGEENQKGKSKKNLLLFWQVEVRTVK